MNFTIHPEADEEIDRAAVRYERRQLGLGLAFVAAVREAYARLQQDPGLQPPADDAPPGYEVRNALLRRFPYRVVFLVESSDLTILAVAHFRRRAGYWHSRMAGSP
jgi:plasmid stabilization system protein ParE